MYRLEPILGPLWADARWGDDGCLYIGKGTYRIRPEKFNRMYSGLKPGDERIHLCDNPPCMSPAHVRGGTHAENMKDAQSKGRMRTPYTRRGSLRELGLNLPVRDVYRALIDD